MLAIENHSKSNISGKIAHISYRSAYLTNRKTYVEYHSSRHYTKLKDCSNSQSVLYTKQLVMEKLQDRDVVTTDHYYSLIRSRYTR